MRGSDNNTDEVVRVFGQPVMPSGKFAPDVMTEEELIEYLRLDRQKANATRTLAYYRGTGKLKATKIGKNLSYSRQAVTDFIEKMTR